jgi:hypothetical protein
MFLACHVLEEIHAVHCTVPSLITRCPGHNGTSHSKPGPRCQRWQLRPTTKDSLIRKRSRLFLRTAVCNEQPSHSFARLRLERHHG